MPTQRLRALLSELHDELERNPEIDGEASTMLRELHDDIEDLVKTTPAERDAPGVLQKLEASLRKFEGSHPDLTAVIQRISDTLSQAGI